MPPQVHSSFDVKNPYGDAKQATLGPGDPGFTVGGGLTSTGALGFGSGDDVVKSIGKKQRELAAGFLTPKLGFRGLTWFLAKSGLGGSRHYGRCSKFCSLGIWNQVAQSRSYWVRLTPPEAR